MPNKIDEKQLNKVSGGKTEYSSTINDIKAINKSITLLSDNPDYYAVFANVSQNLASSAACLIGNNTTGAKYYINLAVLSLSTIASSLKSKTDQLIPIIKQLDDIYDSL